MSLELIIRPEAEADALEAFGWYNEQVPGLGQEFLGEVERALESIRGNPEANRKLHRSAMGGAVVGHRNRRRIR